MGSQHTERALARLSNIADLGYCAFSTFRGAPAQILSTTFQPAWTQQMVEDWRSADDPLISWFEDNLEVAAAEEALAGKSTVVDLPSGSTTLTSDLIAGARIGLVLSHSSDALGTDQVNEARAAALVLREELGSDTETGITTKEAIYLKHVSAGATDDEIAEDLNLSLRAVKERKRKAIDDLNALNIGHAVGIAKRTGVI